MITKKNIGFLLKSIIVFMTLYFLYNQLIKRTSLQEFQIAEIFFYIKKKLGIFILVVLMMCLNWFVEALKWRYLISKIENITIIRSIKAVFSGITVSTFTPNRVGEYGGRVFFLEKADRIQAVLITVIGSMSQLITTILFGSIGVFFIIRYDDKFIRLIEEFQFTIPVLAFLLILLNVLLIIVFINSSILSNIFSRLSFLKRFANYYNIFSFYSSYELMKVLLYSVIRYLIFTTQFYFLLIIFNVDITYFNSMIIIMTMLLVVSIVPTIFITEIGVRASIAVMLFSLITSNSFGVISATFLLWVVNLLLPALVGTFFVFSLRFFRK